MSRARIIVGDCRESMAALPTESVDAVVCDPPYELGFMGKSWDASGIAYDLEVWRQALRVLKPGGHLLAFSGSRTYHRMTCAIEDAGFEIRDQIMWIYGSGFPKSHDVSKAIDKAAGVERHGYRMGAASCKWIENGEKCQGHTNGVLRPTFHTAKTDPSTDYARRWSGWGTALKPAHEPICMARKPLVGTVAANVLRHGTGAINVDGCRVESGGEHMVKHTVTKRTTVTGDERTASAAGMYAAGASFVPKNHLGGRWPANFIHDGSDEATEGLRDAARFFYTAKASSEDRDEGCEQFIARARPTMGNGIGGQPDQQRANNRNIHPTVKPTDLMRYLVRMVTPPGGTVLDPFTGSGSTGRAAMLEGMRFIGCELSPEYAEIARARIRFTLGPLFAHEVT